jgi:alpha-galactosidase
MNQHENPQHAWVLHTRRSTYALGVNAAGFLVHRYWGARLPDAGVPAAPESEGWASFNGPAQLLPEEYPAWGSGLSYVEPCLKATFADGVRALELRYVSVDVNGDTDLVIHLRDSHYPLVVSLFYRAHPDYDLVERFVAITNNGDAPVTLERAFSAQWHPPVGVQYRLSHLTGRWLDEWHIRRDALPHGTTRLESRRIMTGHQHNPWFALDDGEADEERGAVWFGALAWSGSWALTAEVTDFEATMTRVSLGVNDWDFAWQLAPGETFTTPTAVAGWTDGGFGAVSRAMHDYVRDTLLPHGGGKHKVLYNSWEATLFDVDEPGQTALAEVAAEIGVELFVMDDGWFKGRNHDRAGLGDWTPDAKKFPHGLTPLVERVNALGMEFGIWVEPEMINEDSDLYRAHPDWVIHSQNRQRTTARNQMMLNMALPEVQDYTIGWLDALLRNHKITFVKWDANRNVSEPGGWGGREPRELWVRYTQGVYRVFETMRARHPHVIFQSCSGGGGRADLGILRYADQIWASDNTEPAARISIQEGFSQVFPASVMEAWVTDAGTLPLDFRFAVSMCGALGIGANLLHWDAEARRQAREWVALYKEIRALVQLGDQYRLLPAQGQGYSAVQYMAKDASQGVLFVFRTHMAEPATFPMLHLRGLDADAQYMLDGIEGARSGAAWMRAGVQVPLKSEIVWAEGAMEYKIGDFTAAVRRIRRIGA